MRQIAGNRTVIVVLGDDDVGRLLPAELAKLVHDAAQDLVVHPGGVDRIVGPRSIGVIGGIRLLRPEHGQVWLLDRQDVVDEHVG